MKYQTILQNSKIKCDICPRNCNLNVGDTGFCGVRKNTGKEITLETYGYNTGLAIDPIEKKPLYQFYPTTPILSFGTIGCCMGCQFCQNWETTKLKTDPKKFNKTSPEEIVETAKKYNCKSVAFTYNDPIIFFEYAIDTAKLCHQEGIKTVAVTSGFMNPEPAKEFYAHMDAANIDLKAFTQDFYGKNCLAKLRPVLETIKYAVNETDCHVELTTMLIEGENDSDKEIQSECNWIMNVLGADVPLHFSAFFPRYKFQNRKPTELSTLLRAYNIAKSCGLHYVYTGNLTNIETSSTYCKHCGKPVIVRNGYQLLEYNLDGQGRCNFCHTQCDGRF